MKWISILPVIALLISCDEKDVNVGGKSASLLDYEAYKSGNDWGPALQQATKDFSVISIPEGTYHMSAVRVASDTEIVGAGESTVIIPDGIILFRVEGQADDPVPVAADLADFSNNITLSRDGGFSKGDMLILQSQRNCMFKEDCGEWALGQTQSKGRTCFFGEIMEVSEANGCNVTTKEPRIFPFYKANGVSETIKPGFESRGATTAMRVRPTKNVIIRNLQVKNKPACLEIVRFKYALHCRAENVSVITSERYDEEAQVQLFKTNMAKDCHFIGCSSEYTESMLKVLRGTGKVYDNYSRYNNFRIISSSECSFEDCRDNAATHAFSITYANGGIPSVHCSVLRCHSENSIWAGVISQQCTPWSVLSGNVVENSSQGVFAGCRFSVIENNIVKTILSKETDHYYAHLSRGGTVGLAVFEGYGVGCRISGNTVSGFRTGIGVVDGYEQYNIFDKATDLQIEKNVVDDSYFGFMVVRNGYNNKRVNLSVSVNGNIFNASSDANGVQTVGAVLNGVTGVTFSGNKFNEYKTEQL